MQWLSTPREVLSSQDFYAAESSRTRRTETAHAHGFETLVTLQKAVQDFELKLGIDERWTEEFEEWQEACRTEAEHNYQRAIDHLEGLVVSRLFELEKMNRAGTGTWESNSRTTLTPRIT